MPIRIFTAYSHADEAIRDALGAHLKYLERLGEAVLWHDRRIGAGEHIDSTISRELESADIILLLISADFVASDYCWSIEMGRALERHTDGNAVVIPVIIRHCAWHGLPFGSLMATPKDGRPVKAWQDIDEALSMVAKDVEAVVRSTDGEREASPALSAVDATERYSPTSLTALRFNAFLRHKLAPRGRLVLFAPDHGYLGVPHTVWAAAFDRSGNPAEGTLISFGAEGAEFGLPRDNLASAQGIVFSKLYPHEPVVVTTASAAGFESVRAVTYARPYDPANDFRDT